MNEVSQFCCFLVLFMFFKVHCVLGKINMHLEMAIVKSEKGRGQESFIASAMFHVIITVRKSKSQAGYNKKQGGK